MNWNPYCHENSDFPGVYAIYLDRRVVYIGTSASIRNRIAEHGCAASIPYRMLKGHPFRELNIKTRRIDCISQRLALESALIRKLRPVMNVRDNPTAKRVKVRMSKNVVNLNFRKFVNDMGSQANVATLLAMSPGHVSLIYNGKRRVTVDLAERIEIATCGKYSKESLVFPAQRKRGASPLVSPHKRDAA